MMNEHPADADSCKTAQPAEPPPQQPPFIGHAAPDEEPYRHPRWYKRYRKLRKAPIWIEIACALALVGITGFYTYYAAQQSINSERAAVAAENAVAIASHQVMMANNSFKATAEQFRLDQRAWVGPDSMMPPVFMRNGKRVYLKEGEQARFEVILANTGKTPAKNIRERFSYRTLPTSVNFSPKYPTPAIKIGVIQPSSHPQLATPPTEVVTISNTNPYMTGALRLYVYGELAYDDVFTKETHHTIFCLYLTKDLEAFTDCDTYNDAD